MCKSGTVHLQIQVVHVSQALVANCWSLRSPANPCSLSTISGIIQWPVQYLLPVSLPHTLVRNF